jgi:hypothetical protein
LNKYGFRQARPSKSITPEHVGNGGKLFPRRGVIDMPFGMEMEQIESRVADTLSQRPGRVAHFDKYQIELLTSAIATAIADNNHRIQSSLGEVRIDLK